MGTVYKHEMKQGWKNLIIWGICVGGMGFACILLFSSMEESMKDMAESFASMGAFSEAFGMTQLSIATLAGFFATEVGTIHTLGGAMFAAVISTVMLSKEEDGHTSEFLYTLPITRGKTLTAKWVAIVTEVLAFNLGCTCLYLIGFAILGEEMPMREFLLYMLMQVLMQLELAAVCYAISSFLKKNKLGVGLGLVLLFYAYDLIARVVPDLEKYKPVSPFAYANAADILSTGKIQTGAAVFGAAALILSLCMAAFVYGRRDLAA
ncbi:MAG: ABC transporter permease subunit [Lachnospiraceae bacterium]|nr:ABC transporter permease subunit [Lachnospiraceae bacterium]